MLNHLCVCMLEVVIKMLNKMLGFCCAFSFHLYTFVDPIVLYCALQAHAGCRWFFMNMNILLHCAIYYLVCQHHIHRATLLNNYNPNLFVFSFHSLLFLKKNIFYVFYYPFFFLFFFWSETG